ncbi:endonuclease/exonuclease/phosphatase family protein [Xinfangfangia sp. CPCC 101601]|uniref:Endonuclease/exonuclease/phosphatase family protein n=1 Tax=Pseudogemmobacter lacusdianii TaxID=3069608 RepID=A0ABU0VYL4_9RHOB|nr:endonuclease/exonuclease/phosphatase family protein [Xinfangfangia sp. CPCC 101601]MDQ2066845.1 endonuclease/exonuclease/phosphatase family protein [Xinfangfangia sp. CPCC 101601]
MRIATWNADLSREGPGLLARDIARGDDPQVQAALVVIAAVDADILLLTSVDYDHGLVALQLLQAELTKAGHPYPHLFALRPNTGWQIGLDLDQDGRLGEPEDAIGWGRFAGEAGMALLSRLPIEAAMAQDYSSFLWADLPGHLMPPDTPEATRQALRLSTTGHWQVAVTTPQGPLTLLAFHATPPVFDGAEDFNGRRNHDETRFWQLLLQGALPFSPPVDPFVILGDANLDPEDGDGRTAAIRSLLADPALQDPRPRGTHNRPNEPHQFGDPALDTALYDFGGLRVDYVLPSADLTVTAAGTLWPPPEDPFAATLQRASRHAPVWVDLTLP